uniref:J domain-containing protein n=1 Tax=Corethron hystrix TaxID=216773 RepID=A0A7S1FXR4_9STRA|mmetsp:Transcript_37549/g.87550  ORF Transcript_37549/g.87550 Transcript_37549/m.87550 type:complete len:569 (+) Transcript_37549:112-1818(+)
MKINDLKSRLKELGMSQAGDKGTLECRIAKGEESARLGLQAPDGNPVHQMKLAKLKPHAAKVGISPIGTLDEIMFAYIDHLKKKSGSLTDIAAGSRVGLPRSSGVNKVDLAGLSDKVLQLAEKDDFVGILNLGGANVTTSSSVAVLRKAYLKLSLTLHPDKNKNNPNATSVFQALVNAYERISQPDLVEEVPAKKGKKKAAAISRSNEGCKRTRVQCPRCKNPWSESKVEGNPDYFYNFLMMGIKTFNCATCLLEFGCMTAIHKCPFCKGSFEYHPSDFHRKITCGRENCHKKFGFYMFHCSDRVMKNLKEEVGALREKQAMLTEQKRRRAKSFQRRCMVKDDENAETAFLMGLANECPRCGISLADLDDKDEIDHLRNCNDEEKIMANKRKKEAIEDKKNKKKKRQDLQEDVTAKAAWDLLGASNENIWMLTDGALQKECAEHGIDAKGKENHEMISSLVLSKKSQALTKYKTQKGSGKVTADTLPSNLHAMTEKQLRAVAASHGIKVGKFSRKIDIIELLQSAQEGSKPLMITNGGAKLEKSRTSKSQVIEIESGSESEYEPDDDW